MNLDNIFHNLKPNFSDFLPHRFRLALLELKNMSNKSTRHIHITKFDKGGKVGVMDGDFYSTKIHDLLSNPDVYNKIKNNPLKRMQSDFNRGLKTLARNYKLKFLNKFSSTLPSLPYLYGLSKIDKKDISFGPIISNINSPSYGQDFLFLPKRENC